MSAFDRYIFRTTFGAFLLVLISLTAVIWLTHALREIDLMMNQRLSGPGRAARIARLGDQGEGGFRRQHRSAGALHQYRARSDPAHSRAALRWATAWDFH